MGRRGLGRAAGAARRVPVPARRVRRGPAGCGGGAGAAGAAASLRDVGHARLYLGGGAGMGSAIWTRSVDWFLAAAEAYEEAGHAWGVGAALDNAGYLEFLRGRLTAAEPTLKRGLDDRPADRQPLPADRRLRSPGDADGRAAAFRRSDGLRRTGAARCWTSSTGPTSLPACHFHWARSPSKRGITRQRRATWRVRWTWLVQPATGSTSSRPSPNLAVCR